MTLFPCLRIPTCIPFFLLASFLPNATLEAQPLIGADVSLPHPFAHVLPGFNATEKYFFT